MCIFFRFSDQPSHVTATCIHACVDRLRLDQIWRDDVISIPAHLFSELPQLSYDPEDEKNGTVPSYAVRSWAVQCSAVRCRVVPCGAVPARAMQ